MLRQVGAVLDAFIVAQVNFYGVANLLSQSVGGAGTGLVAAGKTCHGGDDGEGQKNFLHCV